eukprot:5553252-Pyramimonas_sp.AAC.2
MRRGYDIRTRPDYRLCPIDVRSTSRALGSKLIPRLRFHVRLLTHSQRLIQQPAHQPPPETIRGTP